MTTSDEIQALRHGCGLADISDWTGRIEILGADRLRFLNAYVTSDIKSLTPGDGVYGFLTSHQGRILSDLVVLALEDRLWLQVPAEQREPVIQHLQKYILADRVEVRALEDMQPFALIGPRAGEALGGPELPAGGWKHARVRVRGTEVELQRAGRFGAEAYTVWVSASIAKHLIDDFRQDPAVTPVSFEALEILRAEAGIPRFGADFGPENFPQETGAEDAVSYTKGCYLGQEIVARIHYRGGVQKILRGLLFDLFDGPAPAPGTPVLHDGREAGKATTVVDSAALGRPIGLAILHKRVEAGTRVELEGGGTAEVKELPFGG
ncbi:MAG: YgfZ/GcvT domain-containing protein [Thermoanaerobaculia bacterium]